MGSYTFQGLLCPTGQPGDPRRGTQHRPAPCGTGGKQPLPLDPGSTRCAPGNPGPVTPGRGAVCLSLRWGGPGMREGGPRSLPGTPVSGTSWAGGNARWLEWNTHRETGGPGRAHPPAQSSHLTMLPCRPPPPPTRTCVQHLPHPETSCARSVPTGRVVGSRVCPLRAGRRHSAQRPSPKPPTSREGQPTKRVLEYCRVPDGRATLRNRIQDGLGLASCLSRSCVFRPEECARASLLSHTEDTGQRPEPSDPQPRASHKPVGPIMGLLVEKTVTCFGNSCPDVRFLLHVPALLLWSLPPVEPGSHRTSPLQASAAPC